MPPQRFKLSGGGRVRPATVAGVILVLWLVVAYALVPWLISEAYAGRGLTAVQRLMAGRTGVALERYQGAWAGLAHRVSLLLVLATAALATARHWRARLARLTERVAGSPPHAGVGMGLASAVVLGLTAGVLEAGSVLSHRALNGVFANPPNPDYLWMAPAGLALLFVVLAILLAIAVRAAGSEGLSRSALLGVLVTLGLWTVLRSWESGIHPWALFVLAAGVASRVAPWVARDSARLRRTLIALGLPMILVAVVAFLWQHPIRAVREARARERVEPAPAGAPNVLLLVLDTTRRHSLSLYGYPRTTTPELERLASRGTVFDLAVAPAPWTLPSHASLLTGRATHELSADWDMPLDGAFPTLADALGTRGWTTGGFVANYGYTARGSGLERGFSTYRDFKISVPEVMGSSRLLRVVNRQARRWPGGMAFDRRKIAQDVNAELLSWLDDIGTRPFFAFLNYIDAHGPYERFDPYYLRFRAQSLSDVDIGPSGSEAGEAARRDRIDRYDSAIANIDSAIGALLDSLAARGVLDRTLVIVTADHGEHIGDHGLEGHEGSLYCPLVCVPLVVAFPGTVPAGRHVQGAVSLQQIPATIADLLDLNDAPFPGPSLRQAWSGKEWRPQRAWVAWSQLNPSPYRDREGPVEKGPLQSVAQDRWHYIRNGDDSEELYDLVADPWEASPLPRTHEVPDALRKEWERIWKGAAPDPSPGG